MAEPANRKAKVHLTAEQRAEFGAITRKGASPVRRVQHARILLLCDSDHPEGRRTDQQTAELVGVSENTVIRVRRRFVKEGRTAALERKPRATPPVAPKVDGRVEAQLVTLCCSTPPEGRKRWTLRLLADELRRLEIALVSHETVRRHLKKTTCNLGVSSATASRKPTAPGSWRTWKTSSTPTARSPAKTNR